MFSRAAFSSAHASFMSISNRYLSSPFPFSLSSTPSYLPSLSLSLPSPFSPPPSYYGLILWFPEYFKCIQEQTNNCTFSNTTSLCAPPGTITPCNSPKNIYLDSLYTALAGIPGTVFGVFTVNIIGPRIMLSK